MSTTWINRGHFYTPHVTPVLLDCQFQVSLTDTAGLGIIKGSLLGQGIQNVFMHTTATPGKGPNGFLNPNPAAGYVLVQLADNFSRFYGFSHSFHHSLSGSSLAVDASDAALTVGGAYVIVTLGTTTLADWRALGVPAGVTPAIGVFFVALATGAGTGSGTVNAPATSGSKIVAVEPVGNPNSELGPVPVGGSPNVGAWLLLQCLAATTAAPTLTMNSYTPAGTNNSATPPIFTGTPATLTGTISAPATTLIPTNPPNNIYMQLEMYLGQSSVKVAGE